MRVSVLENDPGYAPLLIGRVKVFFEGSERKGVLTADEEKREMLIARFGDDGRYMIENNELATETMYGSVYIECDPEALANHNRRHIQLIGSK